MESGKSKNRYKLPLRFAIRRQREDVAEGALVTSAEVNILNLRPGQHSRALICQTVLYSLLKNEIQNVARGSE